MLKDKLLILPLQFFAAESGGSEGAAEGNPPADDNKGTAEGKKDNPEGNPPKTFTQSELDAAISRAVDSHSKKKDKEFQRLLDKAKSEGIAKGKSYADLTEEQRKEQDLEDRAKAIEAKEKELLTKVRLADITEDLQKEGLPKSLAEYLIVHEDNEKVKSTIGDIKKTIADAVNEQVKKTLRQSNPKSGASGTGKAKSYAERLAEEKNKQNKAQGFDPWARK